MGGKCGRWGTSEEAAGIVQARDPGAVAQGDSGSVVEPWLDSGFIFNIEPPVFADKSGLGGERGIKDMSDPVD